MKEAKKAKGSKEAKEMKRLAEMAVADAKDFGLYLDFTSKSLKDVERMAQAIHMAHRLEPLPEDVLLGIANLYGAYLGEVLLRSGLNLLDYRWEEDGEGEIGICSENISMFPVTKVYKRLTQGPDHSLTEFFECMFGLAIGAIGPADPRMHILSAEE